MKNCEIDVLSQIQNQTLLKRIPPFELSYETIAHKKVFTSYNLAIAIPNGKKYYAWFSFQGSQNVCYLLELNRDKKVTNISILSVDFDPSLSLGTIFYGTIIQPNECNPKIFFIVEDIYYFKGIHLKNMFFGEKLGYIEKIFQSYLRKGDVSQTMFVLPILWGIQGNKNSSFNENELLEQYDEIKREIPYFVHHIQLRKLMEISPYLNIQVNNILSRLHAHVIPKDSTMNMLSSSFIINNNKPQYRYATVFQVCADIQFDIYHLYAFGKNKMPVYYSIAYIPNIRSSIFMNNIFSKM